MTARRLEKLQDLKKDLTTKYPSIHVHAVQMDVREKKQIDQVVAELPAEVKNVDVLLNNAGMVIGTDPLVDAEEDVVDQMLATNIKGLIFLTKAIVPGMKERGVGHVINLGSVAGKQAYAGGSIYCGKTMRIEFPATYTKLTHIQNSY